MLKLPQYTMDEVLPDYGNMNLYEYLIACLYPHKEDYPMFQFKLTDHMRSEFFEDVEAMAVYFKDELGMKPGDAYSLFIPNSIEEVVALFALNKIGCIANLIHPLFPSEAMKDSVTYTKSKGVLLYDMFIHQHAAALAEIDNLDIIVTAPALYAAPVAKKYYIRPDEKALAVAQANKLEVKFFGDILKKYQGQKTEGLYRSGDCVAVYMNGGGTTGMGGGVRPANGGQGLNVNLPDRTSQIEQIIKQDDPNFTADDFTAFAKNVYIDIQNAWCKRDLTPVRPVMHTNLYNTTQKQVQSKIEQKVIYHYESIAINTAYLTSFVRDEQYEYLTVYLNARFIDYQTNEESGAIIRGDKNTRWDFRYKMKFMRSVGMKSNDANASEYETGHNCPNCGAPLEMSSSGQCAYCGSVVSTGQYSWVLSDFTTIRNDTKDDGIRVPSMASAQTNTTTQSGGNTKVDLVFFPGDTKIQVIEIIRRFTGCGLKEAKEMTESMPCTIYEGDAETAKRLKATLDQLNVDSRIRD